MLNADIEHAAPHTALRVSLQVVRRPLSKEPGVQGLCPESDLHHQADRGRSRAEVDEPVRALDRRILPHAPKVPGDMRLVPV